MGSQGSVWTHDVTSLYKKLKYTDFAPHHVQPLAAWPSSFGLQLTARSWTVASCRKWRLGHSHSQCMSMQSMSHWKRYQNMPTWIQLDFMKVIIVRIYVDICGHMWIYVDICGYMWIHVDTCGYMWIHVDTCGYLVVVVVVAVAVAVAAHSSRCSPGTHRHRQIDNQAPIKQTKRHCKSSLLASGGPN